MAIKINKNTRQRINECKNIWLIMAMSSSLALTACSSQIGDFGRIDATKARHITESHGTLVKLAKNPDFANPINFSKVEKKFRLTAHLLLQNQLASPLEKLITQKSTINYFISNGLSSMRDRHQAIAANVGKLHNILHNFQKLSQQVLAQDNMRDYASNPILNQQYMAAIHARHRENIDLIQKTVEHLRQLHGAYIYVINHGNIVEPTLNDAAVRDKLARFRIHINELAYQRH